jgi:hypothetical protein
VSYEQGLAYDRKDLSQLLKAFKAMDAEATKVAAETGYELSKFTAGKIKSAGAARTFNNKAARRIVDGVELEGSISFRLILVDLVRVVEGGSYTQPFAHFSLN